MSWRQTVAAGHELPELAEGLPTGEALSRIVERPTVTVDLLRTATGAECVLKRYFFPTAFSKLRGVFRHTGFGTPKPTREFTNLVRLRQAGVSVIEPIASAVRRNAIGLVADGWLWTAYEPGRTLESLIRAETPPPALAWRTIGESVRDIHDAGCWYRNLCARNLIVADDARFVWLDPAKSRWQKGAVHETHALFDLLVFLDPIEPWMPDGSWEAFFDGYGRWPGVRNAKDLLTLLPAITHSNVRGSLLRERQRLGRTL